MPTDVLIIGAGPTGLALALWLTKLGVRVRIVDKAAKAGTTSRALAVQARTLELYCQLDLSDEVVRRGHKTPEVNLWARGEQAARLPFEDIGRGLTPYAFMLILPQDQHEALLIERLSALGVEVERQTELVSFAEAGGGVRATLRGASGEEECEASFIAGCDGARSVVRETLGLGFPGGTYRQVFYVADVEASGPPVNGDLHVDLDEADFLAVFPLSQPGHVRLVGTVRDERAEDAESLRFEDVSHRAMENLKIDVAKVNWFSTYRVHHRVTEHFRKGRAFVLGDAAHIHSPAGGQGMNTGLGDAINLAWKLAMVVKGQAPDALLDSFEAERIGFARRLVATTDKAFSFATADGLMADLIRTRVAPSLMSTVVGVEAAREFIFRTVGQIALNYRHGPLSVGHAGKVHGGDRLPWTGGEGDDNFAAAASMTWQVHVYGLVEKDVAVWCAAHHVPVKQFDWLPQYEHVGLAHNAAYLIRPDSYVAVADASASAEMLERFREQHGLSFG